MSLRTQSSLDVTDDALREISSETAKLVFEYLTTISERPVRAENYAGKTTASIEAELSAEGVPLDRLLAECRIVMDLSRHNGHPRFFGYVASPSTPIGAYADLIASAAEAHGVDPILVQALIQVESNYQARARSPKGAMGLMQLMPSVAREYKVRNAYDPKANIDAGVRKLKSLLEKYGTDSLDLVLAAYNAGEGAIQRFGGIPPYRETQNYVSRILGIVGLK